MSRFSAIPWDAANRINLTPIQIYKIITSMETPPSHKRYPLAEIRRYLLEARQVACQAAEGMTLEEVRQQQETFPEFPLRAEQ